jgi:hypothetical protein
MRPRHFRGAASAILFSAALVLASPRAHAQNLVPDPTFAHGIGAWAPHSVVGDYSMTFVPGFSKTPGSGSALLSSTQGGGKYTVCVEVTGGAAYEWGFSMLFPDGNRLFGLSEEFNQYDGPGCTGASNFGSSLTIFPQQTNVWSGPTNRSTLMPSTRSVEYGFSAVGGVQPLAYVDDVFVARDGTVPPIDPAVPVSALGRLGTGLLAAAIALAGVRALHR